MAVLVALLCALVLVACGGDGGSSGSSSEGKTETSAVEPAEFPRPSGKTLAELRNQLPEGPVFAPAVSVLDPGSNRVAFALFDQSRKQVTPEAVAIYVAPAKGAGEAQGPFPARQESLDVAPQFRSRQTQADLDQVDQFWVADVELPKKGSWVITALASMDGKLVSTSQFEQRVGAPGGPPDVGDKAVKVSTPTPVDAGGNLESIDTRIPPLPDLHRTDFADVLGKKAVVLVFATPQLCQTRVCGPAVDLALETKERVKRDDVEFIHMEIFRDNEINKGLRPQPAAWRLPTEPWTFLIGSDGKIKERFEGAFSVEELESAVKTLR